jgi:outer membrane protein OmpA-like peptidoglycan-associated protein
MRLLEYLFALVALAGLVTAGWWGVYQSPQNAANLQAHLQQETSAALQAAGIDWAVVNMDGQRAILSGKAPSPEAVRDAALTVLSADGPGGLILGGVTQVENAADSAPPVSPYAWRAEKKPDGHFILSGYVPSKAIRNVLLAEAAKLSDGAEVDDAMRLASGAPAGNWQGMARLALVQLDRLDAGEVNLVDTDLRVSGVSADPAVRARVQAEIANVAAPFRGEPMIRGAASWMARVSADGLVFKGNVSSETERREILTLARKHYTGQIDDHMAVVDLAYPGWMEVVRRGLPQFVRFQQGELVFDPEGAGFTIVGDAPPSALAYLRDDLAVVTAPHAVSIAAEPRLPALAARLPLDTRDACQALLDTALIGFSPGSPVPDRASGDALDLLAAVIQSCRASLDFSIAGKGESASGTRADTALGQARAEAVASFLTAAGIDGGRMSAIGYGAGAAEQANDSLNAGLDGKFIAITVLERSE